MSRAARAPLPALLPSVTHNAPSRSDGWLSLRSRHVRWAQRQRWLWTAAGLRRHDGHELRASQRQDAVACRIALLEYFEAGEGARRDGDEGPPCVRQNARGDSASARRWLLPTQGNLACRQWTGTVFQSRGRGSEFRRDAD